MFVFQYAQAISAIQTLYIKGSQEDVWRDFFLLLFFEDSDTKVINDEEMMGSRLHSQNRNTPFWAPKVPTLLEGFLW